MSDAAALRIAELLGKRGAGKTLCPSEVAGDLAGDGGDWRSKMPEVHAAADVLVGSGAISISWQGRNLPRRVGAYRIGLPR